MRTTRYNRERVIREAMIQIFALQLRLGDSADDLLELAKTCILESNRIVKQEVTGEKDSEIERFGSLLRTWHRETPYLSDEGFPRHLTIGGKRGLRGLISAHYSRGEFEVVFQSLKKARLIRRDSHGRWFPTDKHAVFPSLSAELLIHFAEGVARFIETMTRNVATKNREEVLFERSSKVKRLPVSAGPEFRRFVNAQALAFLEVIDDWLEAKVKEKKGVRGRKCTAGVFAFAFMDDLPRTRKIRT